MGLTSFIGQRETSVSTSDIYNVFKWHVVHIKCNMELICTVAGVKIPEGVQRVFGC